MRDALADQLHIARFVIRDYLKSAPAKQFSAQRFDGFAWLGLEDCLIKFFSHQFMNGEKCAF
jgi:hypothetical protein